MPRAQQLPISTSAPIGTVEPVQMPGAASNQAASVSIQVQGAYRGSVAGGTVQTGSLALTLEDAVKRGISYNLGLRGAEDVAKQARALRLAAAAQLLPEITGGAQETVQQINLAAQGLRINVPIPGFSFPTVVGPFNNFDARVSFTESLSLTALRNWAARKESVRSAELSYKDSRELVTLAVAGSYLQLLAGASRIETARTQVETDRTIYQQAVDRNRNGLNARIDVTRSQVEMQMQQQRLLSLSNEFDKQKLALARLIGLPQAQEFQIADSVLYREVAEPPLNELIQRALANRADVRAAEAQLKAAEQVRGAAKAEAYPSLDLATDYGATGINPSQSHGTFSASAAVRFPIFQSGRTQADIQQADAVVAQRRAEYDNAKGQAEQDVRVARLDADVAAQQTRVAQENRRLAAETLEQAQDRFRAGVTDTVEVVQAQEAVAAAEEDYISATFAFNLAQISLARAIGETEQSIPRLLGK